MNNRLNTILRSINNGKGIIDVGTDHGYIPVQLALSDYTGRIIATDINSEPLRKAVEAAEKADVSERIEFRLCDGLNSCLPTEADTIVIAGMGGDLICRIIDDADWLERPGIKLVLQPMTKQEILRYYLINNGWDIYDEKIVKENKRLFSIICCDYKGFYVFGTTDRDERKLTDAELFIGKYSLIKGSPYFNDICERELNLLSKKRMADDCLFYNEITGELESLRSRI